MHLPAGDYVNAGNLLLEDRGFSGPKLRIREIALGQLPQGHHPVQRLVPSGHAMRANHSGGVGGIKWHKLG